jgi:hypothetical protein
MNHPIPYGKQHITEEDIEAVIEALKGDFLTQGPTIGKFEEEFAKYIGCKYAVAVSNGTAALHLCALALGVKNGDRVITTPITFVASSNCIRYCGGEIDFADIDPLTYLIDVNAVKEKLKSKPKGYYKGIIPVDFAGRAVNLEDIKNLANEYNLWIIEDACHAPGGYFMDSNGRQQNCGNGNFADLTIFSFHPVKHIATGEGGMITTNDETLYHKLLKLRTHGITKTASNFVLTPELATGIPDYTGDYPGWYMEMQDLGYNYRITDFQCALGLSQLKRAKAGLERRRKIAKKYNEAFKDIAFIKGQSGYVDGHAYHLYIIEVEDRLGLFNYLRTKNIYSQVHYIPAHLMPYYKQFGWQHGDMPNAEKYYSRCLSLPMYHSLEDREIEYVIKIVKSYYQ